MSHKDWEPPNSWIWLAEIDIDCSLDFSHLVQHLDQLQFAVKKVQTKLQKYWLLPSKNTKMKDQ